MKSESNFNPEINTLDPEKRQKYLEICDGEPDAIYIMARSLIDREITTSQENEAKQTRTMKKIGSYADVDLHGAMSGGHARNTAAAELFKYFPEAKVVPVAWIKSHGPVSYAKVAAEQLKNKYGVAEERIILEEEAYNTYMELIGLLKLALEHNWNHVAVVTNEYQVRRAKAMLENIADIHDPGGEWQKQENQTAIAAYNQEPKTLKVDFVSAEDIIPGMDVRYAKIVEEAKNSEAWQKTVEMENKGAELIEKGEYWKNIPDTSITKNE